MPAERDVVLDETTAPGAAAGLMYGLRVPMRDVRINGKRRIDDVPIPAELLRKIVEDVKRYDLRVAADVVRVLDELGLGRRAYELERRFRKHGEHFFRGFAMCRVIDRDADDIRERIRRIVRS